MYTRMTSCRVPGCKDKTSKRHRLPKKDLELSKKWVQIVGNKRYMDIPIHEVSRLGFVVCDRHFSPSDIVPGHRGLKVTAVPELYLPSQIYDNAVVCERHFKDEDKVPNYRRGITAIAVPTLNLTGDTTNELQNHSSNTPENTSIDYSINDDKHSITTMLNIFEDDNTNDNFNDTIDEKVFNIVKKKTNSDYATKNVLTLNDFSNICRICRKKTDNLEPLFNTDNSLSDVLFECTTIPVSKDDGLPQNICGNCKDELKKYELFRITCETSYNILLNTLEDNKKKLNYKSLKKRRNFNVSNTIQYNCKYCRKECYSLQDFWEHIENEHGKVFICKFCSKRCNSELHLSKHENICPVQNSNLQIIQELPLNDNNLQDTVIISQNDNSESIKESHEIKKPKTDVHLNEPQYLCNYCGKRFSRLNCFKSHIFYTHNYEKSLKCDYCYKRYRFRKNLNIHMLSHSIKNTFICEVCGKNYITLSGLKQHMRIHTFGKKFVCDICNNRYYRKKSLINHMYSHSGEKPHGCPECGKRFTYKSNLIIHYRVHTGEKPYICHLCKKAFTQSSALSTHFSNVHKKKQEI